MFYPWLEPAYLEFAGALAQGRAPSSLIIAGKTDSGAFDLAFACAKYYLCQHKQGLYPCGQCQSCSLLEAGSHPDFFIVRSSLKEEFEAHLDIVNNRQLIAGDFVPSEEPGRRSVRIDSVRSLIHLLNESAAMGQGKAAIINDAHTMPEGAANCILKSFEEPPEHTLIILLTRSLESLLPTLRSRAFKILLKDPDAATAMNFLQQQGFAGPQAAVALALSQNAPLGAIDLLQRGLPDKAVQIIDSLYMAVTAARPVLTDFCTKVADLSAREQVMILGEFVRELLKYKAGFNPASLPLIKPEQAPALIYLQAEDLFAALDALRDFEGKPPYMQPRAAVARIGAFADLLRRYSGVGQQ